MNKVTIHTKHSPKSYGLRTSFPCIIHNSDNHQKLKNMAAVARLNRQVGMHNSWLHSSSSPKRKEDKKYDQTSGKSEMPKDV